MADYHEELQKETDALVDGSEDSAPDLRQRSKHNLKVHEESKEDIDVELPNLSEDNGDIGDGNDSDIQKEGGACEVIAYDTGIDGIPRPEMTQKEITDYARNMSYLPDVDENPGPEDYVDQANMDAQQAKIDAFPIFENFNEWITHRCDTIDIAGGTKEPKFESLTKEEQEMWLRQDADYKKLQNFPLFENFNEWTEHQCDEITTDEPAVPAENNEAKDRIRNHQGSDTRAPEDFEPGKVYHLDPDRKRSTSPPAVREKGWAIDPPPTTPPEPFRYHEVEAEIYKIKHEKYTKKMMEDFKTRKSSWAIDDPPTEAPERLRYADAAAEIYAARAKKAQEEAEAAKSAELKNYEGGESSSEAEPESETVAKQPLNNNIPDATGAPDEESWTPAEEKCFDQLK